MSAGPSGFRRTRAGLLGAAFLAPFSATRLVGPLTLGRAAALTFAALLAADLLKERPRAFRLDIPALLLAAAYVGLSAWIFFNTAVWGCNCGGRAAGFYQLAMIGLLSVAAISLEPRLRGVAIIATLTGLVLAAALALAGVGSINSGTVNLTQTGGRLSGTYGNANELGLAAALGIPIVLAYRSVTRRKVRLALAATALILVATIVLTYSRGAIVAAAFGIVVLALWQARGSRRDVAIILGCATVSVLVGAVLYSVFERDRQEVSFRAVPTSLSGLGQRDLSGWDSRALGPIPRGPSELSNRNSAIAVRGRKSGEGASFRWGEAAAGGLYTLRFRARSEDGRAPFSYTLSDAGRPTSIPPVAGLLSQNWRRFSLVWHPTQRSPHATLYIWQRARLPTFALSNVEVIARSPTLGSRVIAIPGHLEGSLYHRLTASAERAEHRYLQSRLDGAHLALRAFGSEPLRGIGWGTFPAYAEIHLDYGPLAAQDEYLAFAAELGIVGVLLLVLLLAAAVIGIKGTARGKPEDAAVGMLATAAAGLVFTEALPAPQLSIPIAFAAAVVCVQSRRLSGKPGTRYGA